MIQLLKNEKDFAHHKFRLAAQTSNLRIRASISQNSPRFGFIIPKKVFAKVVDRNKVRRRLKSILNHTEASIKPADILLFPQKGSLKLTYSDLQKEVTTLLKKLNLWKV